MTEPTFEQTPVGTATMSSGLHGAQNYHRWTFSWIDHDVAGRVLDVGGGTGNHMQYLTDREVVSIDLSLDCVEALRERHAAQRRWRFEVGDITSEETVTVLGPASFDTVLSCNVFEHIGDDERAFRQAAELLRPGGKLVLVLPAHARLYGDMDRLAGHYRRYDRAMVRARLEAAGLRELRLRYVNAVGAIGWFVNSRFARHQDLSSGSINGQIGLFDRLVPLLKKLEGDRGLPFGQSLICVAQR